MNDDLKSLAELTDALYQTELQKMSAVKEQEAAIVQRLSELDTHRRENQFLPQTELQGIRHIGGDVLWQGWVSRTRQDLMMQLAQVRAQKERLRAGLQRAFGKQLATKEMLSQAETDQRNAQSSRQWEMIDALQSLSPKRL